MTNVGPSIPPPTSLPSTQASKASSSSSSSDNMTSTTMLSSTTSKKLQDLIQEVDERFLLHPAVEEVLLEMSEDFIHNVTDFACRLAKHRKSTTLEAKDVRFCLEKNWGIRVPGIGGPDSTSTMKKDGATDSNDAKVAGSSTLLTAYPRRGAGPDSLHSQRLQLRKKVHASRTKRQLQEQMTKLSQAFEQSVDAPPSKKQKTAS